MLSYGTNQYTPQPRTATMKRTAGCLHVVCLLAKPLQLHLVLLKELSDPILLLGTGSGGSRRQ